MGWLLLAATGVVLIALALMAQEAEAQAPPGIPPGSATAACAYNINNNIPFVWDDISSTGTSLAHGDYTSFTVTPNPAFQFYYCGAWYGSYNLVSKGFLCFEPGSVSCTPCCPYTPNSNVMPSGSTSVGRPAIFAYYTDIHPGQCPSGTGGCTWWQVIGTPGNRKFVYQFQNVPHYYNSPPSLTFQIKLFEATQCAEVHYQSTTNGGNGYQHLMGYQNAGGTAGWSYSYGTGTVNAVNTAWSICPSTTPPPPPPMCTPFNQSGAPGTYNFNAAGGSGGYTWSSTGSPPSGSGSSYSANFGAPGTATVTDSNGQSATCNVNVIIPGCGYTVTTGPTVYDFVDISTTGGNPLMHGDFTSIAVTPSPNFNFNFCGTNYNTFWTSAKGLVCLSNSMSPTYSTFPAPSGCTTTWLPAIPSTNNPNAAVFGFVGDLFPGACPTTTAGSPPSTGRVCTWYQVQGTAPNRVFIYMEKQVPFWSCCYPGPQTFEFKFFEASECVEVHYQSVNAQWNTVRSGYENAGGLAGWAFPTPTGTGVFPNNAAVAGTAWRACPFSPAVNDAFTVEEDAAAANLDVLANDMAGSTSVISVAGGTLAAPGYPQIFPGGTAVSYLPGLDANGADSFTYMNNNGGPGTVAVTVTPVNDAPVFTIPTAPFETAQGLPAQAIPGFATDVAAAAGLLATPVRATDEATQSVTFVVPPGSITNPAIFAVQPTLERTDTATATVATPTTGLFGVLKFTPSATTWGSSQVCFRAQDSGSGVAPNVNQSPAPDQCFTIVVNPCNAVDDAYIAYRWWTLFVPAPGVTHNDAAQPMFPVTVTATTPNGQLDLAPGTGGFDYYADEDFLGLDGFQYTIACGNAISRNVDVTIDVRVNQPPVAYFDQSTPGAIPGQGVSFNPCPAAPPSCSYDPDGEIVSYLWEFGDGYTSFQGSPSHVYDQAGTYIVRLTVRDNVGNTSSYLRMLTVEWPDWGVVNDDGSGGAAAPMAFAGENRTVFEGSEVILSGSQSGAGEGVVWLWTQVRGPEVDLQNDTGPNPFFVAPMLNGITPVDLVFALRVSDGAVMSRPSYVVFHVVTTNHAPVADAGGIQTAVVGDFVFLDGLGSSDPDGDPLTYEWEQSLVPGDIVVDVVAADTATASFRVPDTAGVMRFRLRVSDPWQSAYDETIVAIQPQGAEALQGFTYHVEPLAEGSDGAAGAAVRFIAAAGLEDVAWDFGDGETDAGPTVVHRFAPGRHTVTMTASDGQAYSQVVEVESIRTRVEDAGGGLGALAVAGMAAGLLAAIALGVVLVARRSKGG